VNPARTRRHACIRAGMVVTATIAWILAAPGSQAEPGTADAEGATPVVHPTVLAVIPHDTAAYTEGFEMDGPALYEGTGMVGQSQLRELDPATGAVRRSIPLPPDYFGEGITIVGDRIWQLTYRNGIAIERDKATFAALREVPVDGEGWGLCLDGDRLVRSDGTDRLRFHDRGSFAEMGAITVTRDGEPVTGLNELECVDGQVWAVVWPTDQIVRIDPATGLVNTVADASGVRAGEPRTDAEVLSGIAHVGGEEFLLTGKYWPSTFRVQIESAR
jgi:glutamine cyclotransferase